MSLAGTPVCVLAHDFNCPDFWGVYGRDHHFGLLPKVGDVVEFWDSDPSCGRQAGIVTAVRPGRTEGVRIVYADPLPGTFRYWSDDPRPETVGAVPDFMLQAYAAMAASAEPGGTA